MKKISIKDRVMILALVAAVVFFLRLANPKPKYNSEYDGMDVKVEWSELNFRKKPHLNDRQIIYTLNAHDMVRLTGKTWRALIGEPELDYLWYECTIQLPDGSYETGWVVANGLDLK